MSRNSRNTPSDPSTDIEPGEVSIDELEIKAAALEAKRAHRKANPRNAVQAVLVPRQAQAVARPKNVSNEPGMQIFNKLVDDTLPENTKRVKATLSLTILIGLLRDNASDPSNSLADRLNFDRNNLKELIRVALSKAIGAEVSLSQLETWLENSPGMRTAGQLVFYGLGLNDDSSEQEIKAKLDEIIQCYERMQDTKMLYENGALLKIGHALWDMKPVESEGEGKSIDEVMENPPFQPSEAAIKLDEEVLKQMLREVQEGKATQPASPAAEVKAVPTLDYDAFLARQLNHPAIMGLVKLQKAFRAPDEASFEREFQKSLFDNDDFGTVLDKLNDADPSLRTGLGNELFEGARNGRNISDVLKQIGQSYRLENEEQLLAKLNALVAMLVSVYPALLGQAIPEPAPAEATPEPVQEPEPTPPAEPEPVPATIDYQIFVKDLFDNEETRGAFYPLYYLHTAFHMDEASYDDKMSAQYFSGMSRDTLKAKVDELLGNGMGAKLEEAAKSDAFQTAMLQAVAEFYDYKENPDDLKRRVLEIHKILGANLSPDILHFEDPYRAQILNVSQ